MPEGPVTTRVRSYHAHAVEWLERLQRLRIGSLNNVNSVEGGVLNEDINKALGEIKAYRHVLDYVIEESEGRW